MVVVAVCGTAPGFSWALGGGYLRRFARVSQLPIVAAICQRGCVMLTCMAISRSRVSPVLSTVGARRNKATNGDVLFQKSGWGSRGARHDLRSRLVAGLGSPHFRNHDPFNQPHTHQPSGPATAHLSIHALARSVANVRLLWRLRDLLASQRGLLTTGIPNNAICHRPWNYASSATGHETENLKHCATHHAGFWAMSTICQHHV